LFIAEAHLGVERQIKQKRIANAVKVIKAIGGSHPIYADWTEVERQEHTETWQGILELHLKDLAEITTKLVSVKKAIYPLLDTPEWA
jgi:hypothetical protein